MQEPFRIHQTHGNQLTRWIDELGQLRMTVFREYPYLYEGNIQYERDYLEIYRNSPRSLVVLANDEQGDLIGATTCIPLAEESDELQLPLIHDGYNVFSVMYFGESIVLPQWRGQGLGKEFFARREAYARDLGMTTAAFCAVDRPDDHPLRPAGYQPLDAYWQALGYTRQDRLKTSFSWKETGEQSESRKPLTFWTKTWSE